MVGRWLCRLRLKCSWMSIRGAVDDLLIITEGRQCVYCNQVQVLQRARVWMPRTRNSWWVTVKQRSALPKAQTKEAR